MRHVTIRDDSDYQNLPNQTSRGQQIRVTESWETLTTGGKVWVTGEASRDDAIYRHLTSNAGLADATRELQEAGHPKYTEVRDCRGEPLIAVRKVTRFETSAFWEEESDREDLDELAEMASLPDCTHPPDRHQNGMHGRRDYCGRCGSTK